MKRPSSTLTVAAASIFSKIAQDLTIRKTLTQAFSSSRQEPVCAYQTLLSFPTAVTISSSLFSASNIQPGGTFPSVSVFCNQRYAARLSTTMRPLVSACAMHSTAATIRSSIMWSVCASACLNSARRTFTGVNSNAAVNASNHLSAVKKISYGTILTASAFA